MTKRPAKNVMQFEITASGLTPKVSELDGSVCFDKKSGELVNMIDPPNMNDASGKAYSDSLYYEINAKDGEADTYILTLTIDKKYLKAKRPPVPCNHRPYKHLGW